MKKWFKNLLAVSIILCFAIIAIASTESDEPARDVVTQTTAPSSTVEANDSPEENNTAQDFIFGLNDKAVFRNIAVTATRVETSKGEGFATADEGNIFVGVWFVIENTSNEEQHISTLLLFDSYADYVKLNNFSLGAAMAFSGGTLDGTISPGRRMEGYYAVEIPENTTKLEIEVKSAWLTSGKAVFTFNLTE
jgi:hypothetical protein